MTQRIDDITRRRRINDGCWLECSYKLTVRPDDKLYEQLATVRGRG